jgi:hypothetical protein
MLVTDHNFVSLLYKIIRREIMAKRFDFWTHGIATIIQSPDLAKLVLRQTNLGTVVEQDANVEGSWFHIPLTTPTVMEDDTTIYLRRVGLRAKLNENAQVVRIHIRRGAEPIPIVNLDVNYTNTTIQDTYEVDNIIMGGNPQAGLAMSIFVKFLTGTPRGRVEFQGAGAQFS